MTFTYDLNTNGCLILKADTCDIAAIEETKNESGEYDCVSESDALADLLCNSELDWIEPDEVGALTSAPMLGLRDSIGEPIAAWAFMDYQVRSFLSDLVETGQAVFTS